MIIILIINIEIKNNSHPHYGDGYKDKVNVIISQGNSAEAYRIP